MADHETTGTNGPSAAAPESGEDEHAGALDVVDSLMAQVATIDERITRAEEVTQSNAEWLAALEPRIEAVEQRVASQLELGQDYNRLDAQVSGLQAAFDDLQLRAGLSKGERETLAYVEGGEARDPVVEFGPVDGSLATLESGTGVVVDGRKFVIVGPARNATVKVRPWGGRGVAEYLPSSRVPDEVLSE